MPQLTAADDPNAAGFDCPGKEFHVLRAVGAKAAALLSRHAIFSAVGLSQVR